MKELPELHPDNLALTRVVHHIKHTGERIGYEHVRLGSDLDTMSNTLKGLKNVSTFVGLVADTLRQDLVMRMLQRSWEAISCGFEKM